MKDGLPGNAKYQPGLDQLQTNLRASFNREIGETLGRMPKDP